MKGILTQPGMVWVKQGTDKRFTFALSTDGLAVRNEDGKRIESFWWQECGAQFCVAYGPAIVGYVLRGRDKSVFVKTLYNETFQLEPAKAGDPLPPKKLDRAKSPFYGTSWCRRDGKGALHMLTFSKRGTVSSSDFETKPEWDAFDDQNVRFQIGDKRFKLAFDAEQKRLIGGAGSLREIWFAGRIPPKLGLAERKVLQDMLAAPRQIWVSWNEGKKIIYTFDNNSGVTIVEDDGKPIAAHWKPLGAGCVGVEVGKDNWVFVLGKDADGGFVLDRDGGTSLTLRKTDK